MLQQLRTSPRSMVAAALLCTASLGFAQDLHFTPFEWTHEEDTPDQLPSIPPLKALPVPPEMRALAEPAYAHVRTIIDASGKKLSLELESTSPWLEPVARERVSEARVQPAKRSRKAVISEVQSFLIFNPKSAASEGPDATPRLLRVIPPRHPHSASHRRGVVMIEAEIAASGEVLAARAVDPQQDAAFRKAAAEAVRRWTFAPARAGGQAVAAAVRVPVMFVRPSDHPLGEVDTPPKVLAQVAPEYPFALRAAGLSGDVMVDFTVSVEGRVHEAHVVRSNNPYFDQSAIDAVLAWTFEPALKDGQPVNCLMRVPVIFRIEGEDERSLYYIPRDRKLLAKLPPQLQWDQPPAFKSTSFAAYPFEQLQANVEGEVKINFIVGPNGRVIKAAVLSSANPAFTRAVEAMLDTFEFTPASKAGKPGLAGITFTVRFDVLGTTEAPVDGETRSLLRTLTKKPEHFAKLSQLDTTPRPISRRPPVFPSALDGEVAEGTALIEYIIDRKGTVHAPRIVKASHEEFGYAATQAVRTWKFAPPKKNGKAVDVLVQQPFNFNQKPAPASTE